MMSDFMLDRIDPIRKAQRITRRQEREKEEMKGAQSGVKNTPYHEDSLLQPAEVQSKVQCQVQNLLKTQNHRCSAQTERAICVRAQSCCEHVHEKSGHRCDETWRLQLDHVIPYAVTPTPVRVMFAMTVAKSYNLDLFHLQKASPFGRHLWQFHQKEAFPL